MSNHVCQDCLGREFPSRYALLLHRAQVHHQYEDGKPVEGKTLAGLERVGARVLKLLIEHPETRNPKNWPLWTKYKQYYGDHAIVYDEAHRGWMVNRPDGVMKVGDLKALFGELETARRRRQDYQRADRELYHQDPQNVPLHACVLPKEKDAVLAEIKQGVMRRHYGLEAHAQGASNV